MKQVGSIRVLIVDDSLVFRELAAHGIMQDPWIEVVGFAGDPFEARDRILEWEPDVILLDIELPKMDGITFLKKLLPQYPVPVVVVSGQPNVLLEAVAAGAVDYVKKPSGGAEGVHTFIQELIVKIKVASMANISAYKNTALSNQIMGNQTGQKVKIIAIGASTGGTEAIYTILKDLPENMPGIVITQHMPENFTKMYAERLHAACRLEVKEAQEGDTILPGKVLLAPGGYHMKIFKSDNTYRVKCFMGEKVNGHRPSVDVLFHSVAEIAGANAAGVILTGMGSDGARGIAEMKEKGAYTIGQDEATCVVYGMPKVAYDIGGIAEQLPLYKIAQKLCSLT